RSRSHQLVRANMTPLGKALVFYLHYAPEMSYLTDDSKPTDLSRLPDDTQAVRAAVDRVTERAHEDAADFVQACALELTCCIGRDDVSQEPKADTRNWYIRWKAGVANHPELPPVEFWVVIDDKQPEIRLQIWHGGGRAGEERARRLLGQRVVACSED